MTIIVAGTRSNETMGMDIDQLRGWATFMDRAVVVSLVVTVLSVASLATTTWFSFKFGDALRAHEHAAFDRYKTEMGQQAVELEQKVSTARERALELEQKASTAQQRAAELERKASTAQERALELEQKVSTAQGRTVELEQAAADAKARAAEAARESATSREQAKSAEIDAEEVRKRVAELAKLVKGARPPEPAPPQAAVADAPEPKPEATPESVAAAPATAAPAAATDAPPAVPTTPSSPPSPMVESLRKYAGTKAAVYVIDEIRDAPPIGATIANALGDAGWAPLTWTWTGVGGIFGVTVLVKDGSDPATNEAAAALLEALRTAGFNTTKGDWPASWRLYRGTLNGPQTPGPTDAPIRIVVGAKAR